MDWQGIWAGRTLRYAVAAVMLLTLWGMAIWIAAYYYGPRPSLPSGSTLTAKSSDWQVVVGRAAASQETGFTVSSDSVGEALVIWPFEPFDALARPMLQLELTHFPHNYVLMLVWRQEGADEPFFSRLQTPTGRVQHYLLSRLPNWRGRVAELGLYWYPQAQTSPPVALERPLTLAHASLQADRQSTRIGALLTAWFAPDPWEMLSPSTLGVHPDLPPDARLAPALMVALAIALFVVLLVLRPSRSARWVWCAALLLVAVLVVNLTWMGNLSAQRHATNTLYAGLSPAEKATRLFDFKLVNAAEQVRQLLPTPPTARVFIAADARFFRLRAAWHLRPHNVMTFLPGENIAKPKYIRDGDYLFTYRRPDLVGQARQRSITIAGVARPARLLWAQGEAGLIQFGTIVHAD